MHTYMHTYIRTHAHTITHIMHAYTSTWLHACIHGYERMCIPNYPGTPRQLYTHVQCGVQGSEFRFRVEDAASSHKLYPRQQRWVQGFQDLGRRRGYRCLWRSLVGLAEPFGYVKLQAPRSQHLEATSGPSGTNPKAHVTSALGSNLGSAVIMKRCSDKVRLAMGFTSFCLLVLLRA